MPTEITKTYPFDISDKALEEQIRNLVKSFIEIKTSTDGVKLNPPEALALIALGQTEMQKRINRRAYIVALIAIVLSFISIAFSILL